VEKSPDAFRTISEVADWLGVQAHVLRFWESKFNQVKPVKRAGGRRYYRPSDMLLLGGIKKLLHDDGLTIKGVQKILREQGVENVSEQSQPLDVPADMVVDATADAQGEPNVVAFQSRKAGAAPEPVSEPEPEPLDALPSFLTEPLVPHDEPEAEPEQAPAPEEPEDAQEVEQPALPSFLHRPAATATTPEPSPESAPDPEPETTLPDAKSEPVAEPEAPRAPRPRVVDAPDPAPEGDIPYIPGALGQLAGVDRLTPEQLRDLTPIAEELRAMLDKHSG